MSELKNLVFRIKCTTKTSPPECSRYCLRDGDVCKYLEIVAEKAFFIKVSKRRVEDDFILET